MAISVVMPALEMAQETGKLISWLKKEGETVGKGEPLLEIETDKAVMEIESPADGILAGIKVQAGAEVPVGRTIAWIVKAGETAPPEEVHIESGRKSAAAIPTSPALGVSEPAAPLAREIKISPKARRLASERGIDLGQVHGSGPGGEILTSDIVAAAAGATPASTSSSVIESVSPIARLMAERTAQSWKTIPHFFVTRDIEATALQQIRQQFVAAIEKSHAVKITHSDLLVAIVARALAKHPKMNASWADEGVRRNPEVNINLAMAVSEGVVAPVIPNADQMTLGAVAVRRRDLAERARSHKLRPSDLAGGTFTISNLGMFDVDAFTAIIAPPQAAILAVGRIADRVVPISGLPSVRAMMTLTLSSDHRVVDGARAAEFMRDVADAILNPAKWLA